MNMYGSVGMKKITTILGSALLASIPWVSAQATKKVETVKGRQAPAGYKTPKPVAKKAATISLKDVEKSVAKISDKATREAFDQTVKYLRALQSRVKMVATTRARTKTTLTPAQRKARKEAAVKKAAQKQQAVKAAEDKKAKELAAQKAKELEEKTAKERKEKEETLKKGAVQKVVEPVKASEPEKK
jgi:colicin import membrane protein